MDAAMQMHIAARRCCIAFASYCCPRPEECALLVGEQKCCPTEEDELVPLLSDTPDYGAMESKSDSDKADSKTDAFTLEISGMDCPDCLAKIRKAFDSLPGASIKKIDYIRGLVEVEREDCECTSLVFAETQLPPTPRLSASSSAV
jgi:copper chaperone CopZ